MTPEVLTQLKDPWVRLNNLYYIIDKHGRKVKFQANSFQTKLYNEMHHRNVILKGRQMGVTTLIQLFMLDRSLFYPNISCGVVAHTLGDAVEFFERKIRYAYRQLPEEIRNDPNCRLISDSRRKLQFTNNSQIYVGTNLRGGTYNILHLSEYGILCSQDPKKAQEIADGALNTVAMGNFIFIESTAAGAKGDFYDKSNKAEQATHRALSLGQKLSPLQYKFHFGAWHEHDEYKSNYNVLFADSYKEYFAKLKEEEGITLTQEHKNWYVQTAENIGLNMRREYPSYPAEAFLQTETGSIFGTNMAKITEKGTQICELPYIEDIEVNTFWDLGIDDPTAIIFHQRVGAWDHFIDYFDSSEETFDYYVRKLKSKPYTYGTHYLPHDGASRSIVGITGTAEDILSAEGWRVKVMPKHHKKVAIDSSRRALAHSRFEINECAYLIKALRAYRWQKARDGQVKSKPVHNWASHPADAFQTFGLVLLEEGAYAFEPIKLPGIPNYGKMPIPGSHRLRVTNPLVSPHIV